jgi:hypothetical protein
MSADDLMSVHAPLMTPERAEQFRRDREREHLRIMAEMLFGLRAANEHTCGACGKGINVGDGIVTLPKQDPQAHGAVWHRSCYLLPRPSRRVLLLEERRKERERESGDGRQVVISFEELFTPSS